MFDQVWQKASLGDVCLFSCTHHNQFDHNSAQAEKQIQTE
jgi:hypothetical protein